VGLLVFGSLLVPGFVSYVHRRALAPTRTLSPLVEVATLSTTSIFTNLVSFGLFGLIRLWVPRDTPDVGALLGSATRQPYLIRHLPLVLGWAAGILAVSTVLAYFTSTNWVRSRVPGAPVIIEASAWYHLFEAKPNQYVYLGCDLRDGSYVAGALQWYSTNIDETEDRDLVLSPPLSKTTGGKTERIDTFQRIVISARDICRLYVTYVDSLGLENEGS
jgi:hypothetical protein